MIKGNLIVVPVQNSLIYLQPVYLQSANSAFPAFERIIVATPDPGGLGRPPSAGALNLLLPRAGGSPPPSCGPSPHAQQRAASQPGPDCDAKPRRAARRPVTWRP